MSFLAELKRRNVIRMAILYGVSGWLLLQVGDVLFGLLGVPDWSLRLLLGLILLGFPIALIFSWVYEITPEGLRKERDVDHDASITSHTARKLDLAVLALGVVALAVFAVDRAGLMSPGSPESSASRPAHLAENQSPTASVSDSATPEANSIAVLPFVNMSSDAEQEYFSDGLAESLLHLLAQIDELRVAARTSSFRFKGQTADISDIGRQLNVAHVLEGSVRRSGDTLRVTAQLIKVDDGYHLWSGTYDRQMDDIFAIQDEISSHVVDALKTTLLGEDEAANDIELPARDTENLAAYEAFLRGREQLHIDAYVSLPQAEEWFEKALELDPDYELAMISLGETWMSMANTGQMDYKDAARRLEPLAGRILARNPDSAPGQVILAWARFGGIGDTATIDPLFRRAYESNPDDAFVAERYGDYLDMTGRQEQASAVLERALIRDPMASDLHVRLAFVYDRFDPEKALLHAARAQALEPDNPNAIGVEASIHAAKGQFVRAIDALERARKVDPEDPELPADIAMYLIALRQYSDASDYIELGRQISDTALLPRAAEIAMLFRQDQRDAAASAVHDLVAQGIAPRRWAYALFPAVLQDEAMRNNDPGLFLKTVGDWVRLDLSSPEIRNSGEMRIKMLAVPLLRQEGKHELADSLVDAARNADHAVDSRDSSLMGLAAGDVDVFLESRAEDKGMLHWLFMSLESTRRLAGDHPRYRELLESLAQLEHEQVRLWKQYQETSGMPSD